MTTGATTGGGDDGEESALAVDWTAGDSDGAAPFARLLGLASFSPEAMTAQIPNAASAMDASPAPAIAITRGPRLGKPAEPENSKSFDSTGLVVVGPEMGSGGPATTAPDSSSLA